MEGTGQVRQGDVLMIPVDRVPDGAKEVARVDGRIVIAEGESSGHAHAITARNAKAFTHGGTLFVLAMAGAPVPINHEEHGLNPVVTRILDPGVAYEYRPQRIHDPWSNESMRALD